MANTQHNILTLSEHNNQELNADDFSLLDSGKLPCRRFRKKRGDDNLCFRVVETVEQLSILTSYYIGVDTINHDNAVYVATHLEPVQD